MYSAADLPKEGFPHSDIRGSTIARISPRLFAACHVLHRLLAPRHPPNALVSLTIQPPQRPHAVPNRATKPKPADSKPYAYQLHFHSQIHLSKNCPGESKSQPRGSLGSGPAEDRSPGRGQPMPSRPEAALQDIERGERSQMIWQVVIFQEGRNQRTSALSVTHYP
jgi:hypothetical protein